MYHMVYFEKYDELNEECNINQCKLSGFSIKSKRMFHLLQQIYSEFNGVLIPCISDRTPKSAIPKIFLINPKDMVDMCKTNISILENNTTCFNNITKNDLINIIKNIQELSSQGYCVLLLSNI